MTPKAAPEKRAKQVDAGARRPRVGGAGRDEWRRVGDLGGWRGRRGQRRQEEGLARDCGLAGAPHYQGYGVVGLSPWGVPAQPQLPGGALGPGAVPQTAPPPGGLVFVGGGVSCPVPVYFSAPGAS